MASTVVPPFLPRNSTSQPGCKSSSSMKRSFLDACASGSPDMLPLGYTTSPGLGSSLYSISIVLWTTMYVAVHWTNPSLCKVISALAPQVNVQLYPVKQHYMHHSDQLPEPLSNPLLQHQNNPCQVKPKIRSKICQVHSVS